MLHEEYHKSTVRDNGEIPLDALGSPPQTEMGSFLYSGPSTDMADTVSLPRQRRVHEHPRAWHPDLPITSMAPEKSLDPLRAEPTHGALDRTAESLVKLLSGLEDLDVTALSEAVKAKLGITEPLPKPALLSTSPGLSMLADDFKRSKVFRLLPKVTRPSPFHPRARTVQIADLQDVPVTETEKRGPSWGIYRNKIGISCFRAWRLSLVVSHPKTPIFKCFYHLLWFYVLTVSELSCLAKS